MNARFVSLLALAALLAADGPPCVAEDAPLVLAYRVDNPLQAKDAAAVAAAIVVKRCAHAGIDGVTATPSATGDAIEFRVPPPSADREADVRRLVERRGLVEFRIRAKTAVEDEWRDRRLQAGVDPPREYSWRLPEDGVLQILVETPERAAADRVTELSRKGSALDSPEMSAPVAEFEKLRRESVFTNDDIASASVRRTLSTIGAQCLMHVTVRFEFKDDRKAAFEKFTGDHVGRELCVVVDGKVHVVPTIKSSLPGMGELRAPGAGYTEEQAQEMAALLEFGPLPCTLARAKEK